MISKTNGGEEGGPQICKAGASRGYPAPSDAAPPDDQHAASADRPQVTERLAVFTDAHVRKIVRKIGEVRVAPWPKIEGCLAVLFVSRAGSTYLARELECDFAIGRLRESLNPPLIRGRAAAHIVESRQDPWFSFKAGGNGVIAAELCGFFEAYLRETSFILLIRRDIVAQAVSRVKAKQTEQWHSTQPAKGIALYNAAKIAQGVKLIADGVERLRLYVERSKRPWRPLVYEDFAHGDFTSAVLACDALGVPRRGADRAIPPSPVERIGDAVNEEWGERFQREATPAIHDAIDRYLAQIDETAP